MSNKNFKIMSNIETATPNGPNDSNESNGKDDEKNTSAGKVSKQ